MDTTIPILTLIITLIAVILGPSVLLIIARKQIKSQSESAKQDRYTNTIYAIEQKRLDALIENVTKFDSALQELHMLNIQFKLFNLNKDTYLSREQNITNQITLSEGKIELMLDNNKELDHSLKKLMMDAHKAAIYSGNEDYSKTTASTRGKFMGTASRYIDSKLEELKSKL